MPEVTEPSTPIAINSPARIPEGSADFTRAGMDALADLQHSINIMNARMAGFESRLSTPQPVSQVPVTTSSQTQPSRIATNIPSGGNSNKLQAPASTVRDLPPHLEPQSKTSRQQTAPSSAVQVFRGMPDADKVAFRRILAALGMRSSDILDFVDDDQIPSSHTNAASSVLSEGASILDGGDDTENSPSHLPQHSTPLKHTTSTPVLTTTAAQQPDTPTATTSWGRPLICKQELLGEFNGEPALLEGFIGRLRDVLRSDKTHPGWEDAVVRALSRALKGEAAAWHEGLTDDEAAELSTVAAWVDRLRDEFSMNPAIQRKVARERVWNYAAGETATMYYHDKVRALRQAFGYDITTEFLIGEIKDGLPPEFQQHIRTKGSDSLTLLRRELAEWEPVYRQIEDRRAKTLASARSSALAASRTAATSLERSVSTPALPRQSMAGPPSSLPAIPAAQGLSATYDSSRVTPAANGEPRKYRRPDNDKVMVLDRPCNRCNGDHFNFEHRHLVPQVRILEVSEDDYPTLELEGDGAHEEHILGSSTVWNVQPQSSSALDATALRMDQGKGKERVVEEDVSRSQSESPSTSQRSDPASPKYNVQLHESEQPKASLPQTGVHFLSRSIFHVQRSMPVNESLQPLAHEPHRFGNVVTLPTASKTGTGTGFRDHIPLTIHVRVNGTDSKAMPSLLDTGASLSVMDADLLRRLGGTPQGEPMDVHGLGNARTLGWVTLPVFIDASDPLGTHAHLEFLQDFHIIPNFAPGMCLGQDFIARQDLHISPVRGRARIGRYTFEVTERVVGPYAKELPLILEEDVVMDPGFQRFVTVGATAMIPGVDYTVYPRLAVTPDETIQLAGPAGRMRHRTHRSLLLANYGSASTTLRRGTIVADAIAARVGDIDVDSGQVFSLQSPLESANSEERPLPAEPDDPDVAMPLDAFEGTEPPGSNLVQDAATVMVDDVFRVGVDNEGRPHAPIVDLLRDRKAAFALDGRPGRVTGFDMGISLQPDAVLRPEAPRRASPAKRAAMDAAIDQLLDWDVIEPSNSSVSFPVHMVRQYDKWRFCIDYRQLNTHTIPDRYPLPTIDAIFQTLGGKKWFSALDAIRGYHQLGVRPEDRWKTAFVCHRGLFQYKMVPFGLRNAPAVFQRLMDHILGPLRRNQAVVYIDDSVVATDTLDEHIRALDTLLSSAAKVGLKFSPSKCTFGVPSLTLLGRKVSGAGVAIWADRAQAVKDLSRPTTLHDLYHTLGLFGYYRAFVHQFAEIAAPLTRLLRGWRYETADGLTRLVNTEGKPAVASRTPIPWGEEQQRSFERLRAAISDPPTLAHPNPAAPYQLYVDASKSAFAAILHQVQVEDASAPVPTFAPTVAHLNTLSVQHLPPPVAKDRWLAWLRSDRVFAPVLRRLEDDPSSDDTWVLKDGMLVRRVDDRLALPEGALPSVLRAVHDNNGHFGFMKTYLALSRHFWRPGLSTAARAWVKHCSTCQRTKQVPKTGSLDITHDPSDPFETISLDLILNLPTSRAGNNAALAILDVFSRMVLLTPCSKDITAEGVVAIVSDRVLRMGWRPRRIITDSEAKVSGQVMAALANSLGARLTPSTPYHQQANSVERAIQTARHVLQRLSVQSKAHWDRRALPSAELAINSTPSLTSGFCPFDLVFISHPSIVHAVFDAQEHAGVETFPERLAAAAERLRDARVAIDESRLEQKRRYDGRRASLPGLKVGDFVFIRLRDRPLPGTVRDKLDPRKSGPFRVSDVLSDHRVRLDLPAGIDVEPVFNVEQLDMVPRGNDPFAGTRVSEPVPHPTAPSPPLAPSQPPSLASPSSSVSAPTEADLAPARSRQAPTNLRDFHLGAVHSSASAGVEELLRGPIARPRHMELDGRSVVLVERPVAFLSRLTSVAESRLAASELELCCLAWAFGKLAHLLEGAQVTVITDHSPMEKMLRSTGNVPYGPVISRCRPLLMPHLPNLRFIYRQGARHTNVDALSRLVPDQGRSASEGGHVLESS
ncbi:hypothetical protein A4X13_0g6302 [Tilletia indica]|uniref:RNA-directed DNA polymerase n=1 Tax=Tilletia indica TaxID=43049 RepID=A0A8T8SP59_9BASI|nr:hypothetical protein A4X13_0g6302 [Tilletia indica]